MNSNNKSEVDASYFQTSGALLLAAKDWTSIVENFPFGLGALFLNIFLYQSELVPRWLSVWGLIGALLLLAMGFLRLYGYPAIYLAIPLILSELVLAVWLIVIGINSSQIVFAIVGVLIITALVTSFLSGNFPGSLEDPDELTGIAANENKVLTGVLFQLALTASVVAIPILLFPIISEHSVSLALGYLVARIFEGIADAVMAISMLLLLTLSREYVNAGTPGAKTDTE